VSARTLNLTDRLYDYVLTTSLREAPVLAQLREETAKQPWATMQISPDQGQFMALLVELIGARHCLEIGTFTGYSALAIALALPADGRIITCDINQETTGIARRYWAQAGVDHKIDLRLAPALETLEILMAEGAAGRFDFAFIDANKEDYDRYYEAVLSLMGRAA
jgi:caffeoyl-CoA O-methyltransferase